MDFVEITKLVVLFSILIIVIVGFSLKIRVLVRISELLHKMTTSLTELDDTATKSEETLDEINAMLPIVKGHADLGQTTASQSRDAANDAKELIQGLPDKIKEG